MVFLILLVAGIGLYAAWCSGQDVGYQNAQREQAAHEPEADAGILQPQQQQEGCNANHKAQRRMNCSKLIAAHSGGNAESNAVKENDMPEE